MKKAIAYEIVDHGVEHSQYFQGCGVSFTNFDTAFTGIGNNALSAYIDALDQAYECGSIDADSLDSLLPDTPDGMSADEKTAIPPGDEYDEIWHHVSIRIKTGEHLSGEGI